MEYKMTKREVQELRSELNKVLDKFNKTSKIQMELQNATFGDTVTFKLIGSPVIDGVVKTQEHFDFKKKLPYHGISELALNYKFIHEGDPIKLVGFDSRARKYNIIYEHNSEKYKCTIQHMKNIFKQSAPELLI